MFGKILYYDFKTVSDYKAIINQKRNLKIEEVDVSNDKGASADLKIVGASASSTKAYKGKIQESLLFDCDEFERMLVDRDDFFDLTVRDDIDLITVPTRSIIKFDGKIEIPEEFDLVKLIEVFKPYLMAGGTFGDLDEVSTSALKTYLNNANAAKIPIIVEADDMMFCSKINHENLEITYEEISEFEEDVTIIARLTSGLVDKGKPYYDPLKDYLTLNRTMRKAMGERSQEIAPLYMDSEYRKLELLAIYQ